MKIEVRSLIMYLMDWLLTSSKFYKLSKIEELINKILGFPKSTLDIAIVSIWIFDIICKFLLRSVSIPFH
jgi:hypothetical protein